MIIYHGSYMGVENLDVSVSRANDKVFDTIELFFDGLIEKAVAIERLRYEKPNLQICFCSQEAINRCVIFQEGEVIE